MLRSRGALQPRAAAKELHFNKGGETLKRMQAGVDKLASVLAPGQDCHPPTPSCQPRCKLLVVNNWSEPQSDFVPHPASSVWST